MSKITYAIYDSFSNEFYGYCSGEGRYTTPLAKKYSLVFKPVQENLSLDKDICIQKYLPSTECTLLDINLSDMICKECWERNWY